MEIGANGDIYAVKYKFNKITANLRYFAFLIKANTAGGGTTSNSNEN